MASFGRKRRGFSMLELVVVVAILLIVAGLAIPNFLTMIANARLRGGMGSLSALLQNCRMTAVKKNKIMSVHFGVLADGPVAYIKDATITSPTRDTTDPQVQLGAPVTKWTSPSGTGAPTALDESILGFAPQTGDPSFNARGMPCNYSGTTCSSNIGFVYYFSDTRPMGASAWAAVSITPAGRIKSWYWNGSAWKD